MRQYTSSEWPGPSYAFLYVALREKGLDTPGIELTHFATQIQLGLYYLMN